MGNYNSTIQNQNIQKSLSNKDFIKKLNKISSNFILTQNFQDMIQLNDTTHCHDLVIIISKILKKNFNSMELQFLYKNIYSKDSPKPLSTQVIFFTKDSDIDSKMSSSQKNIICKQIAKFYVKIAHVFASIMTTINPVFSYKTSSLTSNIENISDEDILINDDTIVGFASLQEKEQIPTNAYDISIENMNFCDSRISDLIDLDELKELSISENEDNIIRIKPTICNNSLNNKNIDTNKNKTVYDLPGFKELDELYYDTFNINTGKFDKMSEESKKMKMQDISTLYQLFTGKTIVPNHIKSFKDIPLHSFQDSEECEQDGLLNINIKGSIKNKLFLDYVEHIKKMIYKTNTIRNNLLLILDEIFTEENGEYSINENVTYEHLQELVVKTRNNIMKLYINCEKDFIKAMDILEALVEQKILETNQLQVKHIKKLIETLE